MWVYLGEAWKGHLGLGLSFPGQCESQVTHCRGTGKSVLAGEQTLDREGTSSPGHTVIILTVLTGEERRPGRGPRTARWRSP